MKNIFKILTLLLVTSLVITSCEEDLVVFDNINGQTLAAFDRSSSDLAVIINENGSLTVQVNVTTASSSDRTINFSVVPETTTALAENYTISGTSVTIPANEYNGFITIDATDVSIETTPQVLSLRLDSVDGGIVNSTVHNVSIFQVCPVEETFFTGMYLIEQTSPYVDGPTLDDGSVVEVRAEGTSRIFASNRYPDYCTTPLDFTINLVCNEFVVPVQDTNCRCADASDWFGPATVNDTYDVSDDTILNVTFADDRLADCSPTAQTSYRFTKQ